LEDSVGGKGVIIRNVAYLLGGNVATWVVSVAFWLVVPRIIGPTALGEFNLGLAVAGLAFTIGSLGISTFLLKQIARDRQHSADYVGAGIAAHFVLSIAVVIAVVLFAQFAGYDPHTHAVIVLVTAAAASAFLVAPAFSALQALEKMHLNSIIFGVRQAGASAAAVLVALIFKPDIVVLIAVVLAANVLASTLQLGITSRVGGISLRLDPVLIRRVIKGGLPFWVGGVAVTFYIWIDTVLLSVLASTREVGYYAAPSQIILSLGFVPAIVTFATFPALSSSFGVDSERLRRLTRVSLSVLITLGLPISVGIALVGPNAINHIFGPRYLPSGPAMVVLAFTVVPGYVATLAYYVLAAVDQQRRWAYVMGVMALVNPAINLFTIPYFQSRFGHGSIGAATALLITDVVVFVAGLALMPRGILRPVGSLLSIAARVALATAVMAVPVWFLRDHFLFAIPVGASAFAGSALLLGVFRTDEFAEAWEGITARLFRRLGRRRPEEVKVPA
jgi:O-antigen/teichoic acid export membrane protein